MHEKWDNCLLFLTREVAHSLAEIGDDTKIVTEGSPLTVEDAKFNLVVSSKDRYQLTVTSKHHCSYGWKHADGRIYYDPIRRL